MEFLLQRQLQWRRLAQIASVQIVTGGFTMTQLAVNPPACFSAASSSLLNPRLPVLLSLLPSRMHLQRPRQKDWQDQSLPFPSIRQKYNLPSSSQLHCREVASS